MDRSLPETVRLLGLDVEVGVACAFAAVHWGVGLVRNALQRYRAGRRISGISVSKPASPVPAGAGETYARDPSTWPPGPWRTSP